ncbi:hypothetical protein DFJ74DRAFT_681825 [Hyaloraphidium curvatum]|nr:hypothetical protein DFJ74DRAFT_681825 [Hyaloraphidium curvatum]
MVASQDRSGNNSPSSSLWLPRKVEHAGIEEADDDDVMGFISPTLESMKGNQSAQVVAAAMLEFADLGTGRRGRVSSALMLPAAPAQLLPSLLDSRFDQQKIHQGSLESHVLDGLLGALSEAASDGVKSTSFRGNHTRNTAQIEELDNDQDMDNRGADITLIDLRVEAPRARRPNLAAPPVAEEPTSNTDGDDGIVALFMQLGELVSRRLNAKDAEARLMFEDAASEVDQTLKAMLTSTLKSRMQSINGYATEMERAYESLASGLGRK